MSTWTTQELDTLGGTIELGITTRRGDGTLRPAVPIWVVRVGDHLYVRSYLGAAGGWYRHARRLGIAHVRAAGIDRDVTADATVPDDGTRAAIDAQYRSKYAASPTHVPPMLTTTAIDATLRLDPID